MAGAWRASIRFPLLYYHRKSSVFSHDALVAVPQNHEFLVQYSSKQTISSISDKTHRTVTCVQLYAFSGVIICLCSFVVFDISLVLYLNTTGWTNFIVNNCALLGNEQCNDIVEERYNSHCNDRFLSNYLQLSIKLAII